MTSPTAFSPSMTGTSPQPSDFARAAARRVHFHAQRVANASDVRAYRLATWIILGAIGVVCTVVLLPIAILIAIVLVLWFGLIFLLGVARATYLHLRGRSDDAGRMNVRVKRRE
jgi:hypothetical protein